VRLLSLLAPLLFAASFEPIGWWFLAPIAFAIYLKQLSRGSFTISYSFFFGFIANLLILSWSGRYVGAIPWLLLAILQSLYFLPIGLLARYSKSVPLLIVSLLFMEEIKARAPFGGFAWTRVAYSQVESPLAPIVSIGGVLALSFVTLLLASLLIKPRLAALALIAIALLAPAFTTTQPSGSQKLTFLAVQGGTPSAGLDFNSRAMGVLDMHISQTLRSAPAEEELIIWPENAIDVDPIANAQVNAKVRALIADTGKPLLAGAVLRDGAPQNAAILFDDKAEVSSIYIKRYLTPFGEYMPLRSLAEFISPFAKKVNDFSPGQSQVIHTIKGKKIASVLCFEILNDGIVRQAASQSGLMVIHTNSATFAGTAEGAQQLAITRLRALEHDRSIISVSTTGPSAIIDEKSNLLKSLEDGEIGSLGGEIKLRDTRTISSLLGGFAPIIVLVLTILWALYSRRLEGWARS
jgi:apolipoprotein N-acyltransferase